MGLLSEDTSEMDGIVESGTSRFVSFRWEEDGLAEWIDGAVLELSSESSAR